MVTGTYLSPAALSVSLQPFHQLREIPDTMRRNPIECLLVARLMGGEAQIVILSLGFCEHDPLPGKPACGGAALDRLNRHPVSEFVDHLLRDAGRSTRVHYFVDDGVQSSLSKAKPHVCRCKTRGEVVLMP